MSLPVVTRAVCAYVHHEPGSSGRESAVEKSWRHSVTPWEKSRQLIEQNQRWIPGGVVSLNRKCEPNICFTRGQGSRVWDLDGNEYIDYQAGFAAFFLGHNDADVNAAVAQALQSQRVLMGAGPTDLEG